MNLMRLNANHDLTRRGINEDDDLFAVQFINQIT